MNFHICFQGLREQTATESNTQHKCILSQFWRSYIENQGTSRVGGLQTLGQTTTTSPEGVKRQVCHLLAASVFKVSGTAFSELCVLKHPPQVPTLQSHQPQRLVIFPPQNPHSKPRCNVLLNLEVQNSLQMRMKTTLGDTHYST